MNILNSFRIYIIKIKINFLLKLTLILFSIDSTLNGCNRSKPILLKESNECTLKYCSEEDFKNENCIIDNDIIRTQWLNNIINFGDKNCGFTKIEQYSNGDMIAISQINQGNSSAPYFYGLKQNGRPFFIKNGKETPYNPLNNYIIPQDNHNQYNESEVLIVKSESNEKENILILERQTNFIELFNFDNNDIDSQQLVYKKIPYFSGSLFINSTRSCLFNLKDSKYFLFSGIFTLVNYGGNFFYIFKLYYEDNKIIMENNSTDRIHSRGNMVSCYETEDCAHIFCFYLDSLSGKSFKIAIYNNILNKISDHSIVSQFIEATIFFKCIHYEGDKGIFIYYNTINNAGPYPFILFKTKKDASIADWDYLSEIRINSYFFEYSVYLNDIIKISNEIICFSSVSPEKDILYIVIINIFDNESKVKIRYYLIRSFELYNYKFYLDLRLYSYKEFITISSSYCNQTDCEEGKTHYSSLIIFSYPNSTDNSKNIIDELFEKNELIENLNITLSLSQNVTIENNIFGIFYSKILIKTIQNCDNVELISSSTKASITPNYSLEKDEDIYITFNDNNDIFNCSIGYIYEITEPDYDEFEKYPENKDISNGDDNKENFNKKTYSGRLSYYNLYLNDKLTTSCTDNCGLCYDNEEKGCIVCNSNYNLKNDSNGIKNKICFGQEIEETEIPSDDSTYDISSNKLTDIISDIQTEELTETSTEEISVTPTEEITETSTEEMSDILTEEITEIPTEKISDNLIENISDKLTNKITDQLTEITTDQLSDKITEHITEVITNNIKDKLTDKITDKLIEQREREIEEILSSQCTNETIKDEQFQDLSNQFKKKYLNNETNDRESKKFKAENLVLEITGIDKQDENDPSISYIDLGECEEILKKQYNIPPDESLIIYKTDIKKKDLSSTYVQYEIFHPHTLDPLDYLTFCSNEKINILVPVNLKNDTKSLFESLNNSGYNLFDKNDSFYNDICAIYTTENGTDINLNDRQNVLDDSGGNSFCQSGCTIAGFNNKTQKAKCNCDIKETQNVTNLNDILFPSNLLNNILEGFKYSNYLVMKCYKLIIDFELLKKNIGFIFMMIIFISLLVLLLIYFIKGRNKIDYYIQAVLNNKSIYIKNRKNFKRNSINTLNGMSILNNLRNKDKKKQNKKKQKSNNKNKKEKNKKNNGAPIKKSKDVKTKLNIYENTNQDSSIKNIKKMSSNEINNFNINIFPINNLNYAKKKKKGKDLLDEDNAINKKMTKKSSVNLFNFNKEKLKKNEKSQQVLDLNHINYQTLNIHELNSLEYKKAILVDKRTFTQYYCSLIRKKHLIIFTFVPIDDYNLLSLKISSFLLQFSLYITINAFFFSDSTMHEIYTNNGNESFLYHIPQIIYSSLISVVINSILRQLSLSENDILAIKQTKLMKSSNKKAKEVKNFLRIKFIIFFGVSFILITFCWYFISCFCAVYTNTQIILIKDTFLSFCLSMVYPFGINLIPGLFRIPALRDNKQEKECLYKFSQLLSFI